MKDYTPKTVGDIVFESAAERKKIFDILNGVSTFPNYGVTGILLHGKPGTGKTTLANLLPEAIEAVKPNGAPASVRPVEIWCDKASNGVAVIERIKNILSTAYIFVGSGLRYFILHEVDNLTPTAMKQLKSVMEQPDAVFIMTTNHAQDFEEAIFSRCVAVSFNPKNPNIWLQTIQTVLNDENVTGFAQSFLSSLVTTCNFDARKIFSRLEVLINDHNAQAQQPAQVLLPAIMQAAAIPLHQTP